MVTRDAEDSPLKNNDMNDDRQESITIDYNGTPITGTVEWMAKRIQVEITSPFQKMSSGGELFWLAPRTFEEPALRHAAARSSLIRCYQFCQAAQTHWHVMRDSIRELDKILATPSEADQALRDERMQLRKRLRSGDLPKKEYDVTLRPVMVRMREAHAQRLKIITEFLRSKLPPELGSGPYWLRKMANDPQGFGLRVGALENSTSGQPDNEIASDVQPA